MASAPGAVSQGLQCGMPGAGVAWGRVWGRRGEATAGELLRLFHATVWDFDLRSELLAPSNRIGFCSF